MQLGKVEGRKMNGYTNKERKEYVYGKYQNPQVWGIYLADLPKIEGSHILHGKRPVIVYSNNICNNTSTEINVYPITKKLRNWIPTHVTIYPNTSNGLKMVSQVYLEQGRTIPKNNLLEYWGRISDLSLMLKIGHGILIQNGMLSYMNAMAS